MYIAIKSEMDSRPLLYPLMRCLYNYGSILVLSNNKVLKRLIEDEVSCGFRNITVLVDNSDSADEICKAYGIATGDYDFIIMDNLGSSEYDVCFIVLGANSSEMFESEVELFTEDDETKSCVLQFGKVISKQSKQKISTSKETRAEKKERLAREKEEKLVRFAKEKEDRKKKQKKSSKNGEIPQDYNPAEKFMAAANPKKVLSNKSVNVPFPNFQEIETLEAEHKFPEVNRTLADAIYDVLKETLAVEKIQFQKEVRKKDESSGYISRTSRKK